MSNINKQARDKLKSAAAKAVDNFDPNMFVETRDVLALLDELEAADALNKHLELAIRKAEGCSEALRRKAEAAEKRIAELEGREVKTPELKMLSDYLREVTMREREDILLGVKLEFHRELVAAGIITRIEG